MKRTIKRGITILFIIIIITIPLFYITLSSPPVLDSGIVKMSRIFTGHLSCVWAVKFSPDGNLIASCSVDSTVIIQDRKTGLIVKVLKQPDGITSLDFSPDGKFLVTGSYDFKVRLWTVKEGSLVKMFSGHTSTVWTVAFSPNGKTIASAGEDAVITIHDIASGNILQKLPGHTRNIWSVKFSPDGNMLASGSFDSNIKLWDINKGKLVKTISSHTEAVVDLAFSHNGEWLASTSDDKTIKIWQMPGGSQYKRFEAPQHIYAVAFSPDDKRLMTGGSDKGMLGELIQNFTGDSERFKGVSARLWDMASGKIIQTFNTHKNDVNDVSYSEDGLWIATASADCSVHLWQLKK